MCAICGWYPSMAPAVGPGLAAWAHPGPFAPPPPRRARRGPPSRRRPPASDRLGMPTADCTQPVMRPPPSRTTACMPPMNPDSRSSSTSSTSPRPRTRASPLLRQRPARQGRADLFAGRHLTDGARLVHKAGLFGRGALVQPFAKPCKAGAVRGRNPVSAPGRRRCHRLDARPRKGPAERLVVDGLAELYLEDQVRVAEGAGRLPVAAARLAHFVEQPGLEAGGPCGIPAGPSCGRPSRPRPARLARPVQAGAPVAPAP